MINVLSICHDTNVTPSKKIDHLLKFTKVQYKLKKSL